MTLAELIEQFRQAYKELTGREVVVQEMFIVPMKEIHEKACVLFTVDPLESSRRHKYLIPRTAMFQVARDMKYTYMQMEVEWGWDHSSCLMALQSKITTYPEYTEALEKLRNAVTNK